MLKPNHFVDNERLVEEYRKYRAMPETQEYFSKRAAHQAAKDAGANNGKFKDRPPPLPEFVSIAIYKIAKSYAMKPTWRHIPHIEEMISDAILTGIKYAHNYDPDKGVKAFGYLTQIVNNAFKMTINKEKHQRNLQRQHLMRVSVGQEACVNDPAGTGVTATTYVGLMAKHYDNVAVLEEETRRDKDKTEALKPERKRRAPVSSMEGLFDDDDDE